MTARPRHWILFTVAAGAATGFGFACGDHATERGFGGPPDASADAIDTDSRIAPRDDAAVPIDAAVPFDGATPSIACASNPCVVQLVAGQNHYCARIVDGRVFCWGDPSALAIADGGPPSNAPAPPAGLGAVKDIAAGGMATCAVLADGGVACWDQTTRTPARVEAQVEAAERVFVSADGRTRCVLTTGGDLYCWGTIAALGTAYRKIDVGGAKVKTAGIGYRAGFAVDAEGTMFSWGSDLFLLGRTPSVIDTNPGPVEDAPPILGVEATANACAVSTDGRLFCWGKTESSLGQLGLGHLRDELRPTQVLFEGPARPQQVDVNYPHACVRMTDGSVFCWGGGNARGERALAPASVAYEPIRVDALGDTFVVAVATGNFSTCALAIDGRAWCWGDNAYGQIGQGTTDSERHPLPTAVVLP